MPKKEESVEIDAMFEQLEAHARNIAILIGSYYLDLKKAGIPDDLAYILTEQCQDVLWNLGRGQ